MDDQGTNRASGGRLTLGIERDNPNAPVGPNLRGFVWFVVVIAALISAALVSFSFEFGYLLPAAIVALAIAQWLWKQSSSALLRLLKCVGVYLWQIRFSWRLNLLLCVLIAIAAATFWAQMQLRWENRDWKPIVPRSEQELAEDRAFWISKLDSNDEVERGWAEEAVKRIDSEREQRSLRRNR